MQYSSVQRLNKVIEELAYIEAELWEDPKKSGVLRDIITIESIRERVNDARKEIGSIIEED